MLRIVAVLATVFVVAHAIGEFTVLHSPDSVKFSGDEQLDQSSLKEVLSASLGFTTHKVSYFALPRSFPLAYLNI